MPSPTDPCPCGLPAAYRACCGRLHDRRGSATTAEQLMRSRYSAFAVHDEAYLLLTWHPSTRPREVGFDPAIRWRGLDVLNTTRGRPHDDEGTVEFSARYTALGRPGELRENSRFVRHGGAWVYVDGVIAT